MMPKLTTGAAVILGLGAIAAVDRYRASRHADTAYDSGRYLRSNFGDDYNDDYFKRTSTKPNSYKSSASDVSIASDDDYFTPSQYQAIWKMNYPKFGNSQSSQQANNAYREEDPEEQEEDAMGEEEEEPQEAEEEDEDQMGQAYQNNKYQASQQASNMYGSAEDDSSEDDEEVDEEDDRQSAEEEEEAEMEQAYQNNKYQASQQTENMYASAEDDEAESGSGGEDEAQSAEESGE